MLKIKNLTITKEDKTILDNISLELKPGEIYAISGQNGSGKSTLAQAIMGNPEYSLGLNSKLIYTNIAPTYQQISVTMKEREIPPIKGVAAKLTGVSNNLHPNQTLTEVTNLTPDQRSHLGIFVSMQYPTEIPGVKLLNFLKLIIENNRKNRGLTNLTTKQSMDLIHSKLELIGWSKEFLERNVNEGMSGGERKKCEILQMLLLDPKLIILDEIDSGLDKEALELIVKVVMDFMDKTKTLVVITHQEKILDMIKPDQILNMKGGKIDYRRSEYFDE
jgi:Fe-S cluster assembly ATP-binding protein